jgi:ATP:corrinoid adenosyltransferase
MKSRNEIEKLLEQAPVPSITDGPHRQHLRTELLQAMQAKETEMSKWKIVRSSRALKVAAAILAAVVLVSTGWATERVYRKITGATRIVHGETERVWDGKITRPDGKEILFGISTGSSTSSDDPNLTQEQVRQKHEEMKQLVARGEYELIRTDETESGETIYTYKFVLSDGEQLAWGTRIPLGQVASWDEYQQKVKEQAAERMERIKEAIAAGRFRLLNVDVIKSHICRDAATGEELRAMQIVMQDGELRANICFYPLAESKESYSTSWDDHLQAIADGQRELTKLDVLNQYTYEITFEDGSIIKWSYGGAPLEKAE